MSEVTPSEAADSLEALLGVVQVLLESGVKSPQVFIYPEETKAMLVAIRLLRKRASGG